MSACASRRIHEPGSQSRAAGEYSMFVLDIFSRPVALFTMRRLFLILFHVLASQAVLSSPAVSCQSVTSPSCSDTIRLPTEDDTMHTIQAGEFVNFAKKSVLPPAAIPPVPSDRQLWRQGIELAAFLHFGMNTFTDREWGTGAEDPRTFNPSKLNASQWMEVLRDAGVQVSITLRMWRLSERAFFQTGEYFPRSSVGGRVLKPCFVSHCATPCGPRVLLLLWCCHECGAAMVHALPGMWIEDIGDHLKPANLRYWKASRS